MGGVLVIAFAIAAPHAAALKQVNALAGPAALVGVRVFGAVDPGMLAQGWQCMTDLCGCVLWP